MWLFDKIERKKTEEIIKKFLKSYAENEKSVNKKEVVVWLKEEMQKELPDKTAEEIDKIVEDIFEGIKEYLKIKEQIAKKRKIGIKSEDILANELIKDMELINNSPKETLEYLKEVNEDLTDQNILHIYNLASIKEPELVEKELEKWDSGTEKEEVLIPEIVEDQDDEMLFLEEELGEKKSDNGEFSDRIVRSVTGSVAANSSLQYVNKIRTAIDIANKNSLDTIFTKSGSINQNPNLDGFLFEAEHANTFNIDAAIKGKTWKAENLVPKPGETYGKNSVDLVIKDGNKIVKKYQAKLCKNLDETMKAFQKGDYYFQRKLASSDQGTGNIYTKMEYNGVESKAVTKAEMKYKQEEIQKGNIDVITKNFKEDVSTLAVTKEIAGKSLQAAKYGFLTGMAFSLGKKALKGEEIEVEDVLVDGLKTGANVGMSSAVAGGLKVAVEKGFIKGTLGKILSNGTVVGVVASSSLEIISSFYKLGKGEITFREAASNIGESMLTNWASLKAMSYGGTILGKAATVGIQLFTTVASVISAPVALTIGAIVGLVATKTGKTILKGAGKVVSKVAGGALTCVKAGYEAVKSVASCAWNGVKAVGSAAWNGVKAFGRGIASLFGW